MTRRPCEPTPMKAMLTRSEEHTSELQSRPHLVCRLLLEKKKLRQHPPFIRRENFSTNQSHGAALVIFANSFARARSGNAGTNNEIITPNHMRTRTIISPLPRRQAKSLKVSADLGLVSNILSAYGSPRPVKGG